MAVHAEDLPIEIQQKLGIRAKVARAQRAASPQPDQRWRCECGKEIKSQAELNRHGGKAGHLRIELILR